jgi:Protein of unknown function (DUF3082)
MRKRFLSSLTMPSPEDTKPDQKVDPKQISDDPTRQPPTPLRCILGAIVAGFIASLLWRLTNSIAISFASTPIDSPNMIVIRMSTAVRTLVVGMSSLGTGIFALAAVGLTGLAIQLLLGKMQPERVE